MLKQMNEDWDYFIIVSFEHYANIKQKIILFSAHRHIKTSEEKNCRTFMKNYGQRRNYFTHRVN